MKMRKFLAALQTKVTAQPAPLCNDANTVLELLYNAYYEHVCTDDTDEIKEAFDELCQSMTGKTYRENVSLGYTPVTQKRVHPFSSLYSVTTSQNFYFLVVY